MKKIDRLISAEGANNILHKLYEIRSKYRLNDPAVWDLINTYWYYLKTGKGVTLHQIRMIHYRTKASTNSIKLRRNRLIKKGLLKLTLGKASLTELGMKEVTYILELDKNSFISTIQTPPNAIQSDEGQRYQVA